ncbi:MAG: TorF family putative porin [Gammaproteobacteria bacterium]|nr:TorF family putative porin [Gammaproteobacteria bacterium]MCK5092081.1 TorF family putative porin [Gammaproteobacteria bacterium]
MMSKVAKIGLGSVLASSVLASSMAIAEVPGLSANVGIMSQYFYRGVQQVTTATASAGIDYDIGNGFSVGAWGADVEDGVETDIYGSYSGEISGFSYSIGATGYYYSGQFDTEYEEINLGLSYGPVSLEHSIGTWDGDFDAVKAGKNDEYSFTAITGEYNGLYATFGAWGDDADGDYYEVGYNAEFSGFDVGAFYVSGDDDANALTTDTTSLIFTIGKSFDL